MQEILTQEEIRLMFSMLRDKVKDTNSGQLSNLQIAKDKHGKYVKVPCSTRVFTQKTQIETLLLERNTEHLAQAKNTPFAQRDLSNKLKWDGIWSLAKDLLIGCSTTEFEHRRIQGFH